MTTEAALLATFPTPCAVVDRAIMDANIAAMRSKAAALGVTFRPHLKTAKSLDCAALLTAGDEVKRLTVSTLKEAELFADNGYTDIVYAVGIVAHKVTFAAELCRRHPALKLTLITDHVDAVAQCDAVAKAEGATFNVLVEVDVGHHRGGVTPDGDDLLAVAQALHKASNLNLGGVLTHAGHSYKCHGPAELTAMAETERSRVVTAAARIRAAGLPCDIVSAGSTPTATHSKSAEGLTELRAGVCIFQDCDQAGIGSCTLDNVALTVLTTVIGHNAAGNKLIVDAGGLAMSKDLCAGQHEARFGHPVGYGLVDPRDCAAGDGLYVAATSQEHGHVMLTNGGAMDFAKYPVGTRLRVKPNHACYTAAAYEAYHVVSVVEGKATVEKWARIGGWP